MENKIYFSQKVSKSQSGDAVLPYFVRIFGDLGKRVFDVFTSSLGLLVLLPFFILVGIWIKRNSPGPVFYKGKRSAKGGGTFDILKFRTMYEELTSYQGPKVTANNDQRITPVGRWLRDTKINELPQLWNVLKGDMSLVGPRPEDPDIVATWQEEARGEILSVRPGITSPASVIYRHEERLLDTKHVMSTYFKSILPSKNRLDQLYVRNRSFWLDVDVLIWTLLVLLPGLSTYQPPENYLFWGPIYRFFRRYVSWFLIDIVVTFAAFGFTGLFWSSLGPLQIVNFTIIEISLGFALFFSATGAILGVNKIDWSKALFVDSFDLLPALGVATLTSIVISNLLGIFPPALILLSSLLAFAGFIVVRYRSRLVSALAQRILMLRPGGLSAREKVLIVGSGQGGQFAAKMLSDREGSSAYHVIGFIDDNYYRKGERIRGVKVLGSRGDIPSLVKQYDVGLIIFAIHNISSEERQELVEICQKTPASLFLLPDFMGALDNFTLVSQGHNGTYDTNTASYEQETRSSLAQDDFDRGPLEDFYDHDQFMKAAEQIYDSSLQSDSPLIAIMFEIDQFELLAEKYGKALGDQLLEVVASQSKKVLRNIDLFGQYDGGKLVVLIPNITITTLRIIMNRLVKHITELAIETSMGVFQVNLNLGVAGRTKKTATLVSLLDSALADLIVSKQSTSVLRNGIERNEVLKGMVSGGSSI